MFRIGHHELSLHFPLLLGGGWMVPFPQNLRLDRCTLAPNDHEGAALWLWKALRISSAEMMFPDGGLDK